MNKVLPLILIFTSLTQVSSAQYVKDWRYELGGNDGLQNLRGTNYYPYPSDYQTPKSFDLKGSIRLKEDIKSFYAGDVTGDGLLEIVVYHPQSISILNNRGSLLKEVRIKGNNNSFYGILEDIDHDGTMDMICGYLADSSSVLSVFSFAKGEIFRFEKRITYPSIIYPMAIRDNKLYGAVSGGYKRPVRGYIAFDITTGEEIFFYEGGAIISLSSISDTNEKGNFFLSNYSSIVNNNSEGAGVNNTGTSTNDSSRYVVVIDNEGNEQLTRRFKPSEVQRGGLETFFLKSENLNHQKLLVFGDHNDNTTQNAIHFILDVKTGAIQSSFPFDRPGEWKTVIADINHDGIEEIISSRNHIEQYIFDQQFQILAKSDHLSTVKAANDLNGDGEVDIIGESGDILMILDQNLREQWNYSFPTGIQSLKVSDLDFNGRNEIIANTYPNETNEIYIIEAADNPELPAPKDLSASSLNKDIRISWGYQDSVSAKYFNIYRHIEPWFMIENSFLIGTAGDSDREFRDTSVIEDKYYYKVTAVNEYGHESFSSSAAFGQIIRISWMKANESLLYLLLSLIIVLIGLTTVNRYIRSRKDQESLLAKVFDDSPVSTLVLNSSGNINYLNNSAKLMLKNVGNLEKNENFLTSLKQKNMTEWYEIITAFIDDPNPETRHELPFIDDEKIHTLFVILRKIQGHNTKSLIHFTAIDISNQLTTKTALAWTSMAHALAHEIKNPLTTIQLALQSLNLSYSNKGVEKEVSEKFIRSIDEDIERIRKETNRLMQFSANSRTQKSPVALLSLVKDIVAHYEIFKTGNVELIVEIPEQLAVIANKDMLELALKNIVENGLDAMQGKGKITIRSTVEDRLADNSSAIEKRVRVEILDSGCGIPNDNLNKIFEPKFTTKEMGAGFGLSIVRHIIDEHNGKIEIVSKKDVGTSVFISLPYHSEKP